ncbi:MAG: hypothetical protein WA733_04540 [Methylocystis sp.]
MNDDDIIGFIENFKFDAGPVAVERRNRGFTLIHAATGLPIARLRPIGRDDLVDILYWSLWRERWVPFGPLWTHRRTRQTGRAHHLGSGDFLGRRLKSQAKIPKVQLRV